MWLQDRSACNNALHWPTFWQGHTMKELSAFPAGLVRGYFLCPEELLPKVKLSTLAIASLRHGSSKVGFRRVRSTFCVGLSGQTVEVRSSLRSAN